MLAPHHPEVAQAELAVTAIADGLGALLRLACGVLHSLEAQHELQPGPLPRGAPAWPLPPDSLVALLESSRAPLRDLANVLAAASTMVDARWEVVAEGGGWVPWRPGSSPPRPGG